MAEGPFAQSFESRRHGGESPATLLSFVDERPPQNSDPRARRTWASVRFAISCVSET